MKVRFYILSLCVLFSLSIQAEEISLYERLGEKEVISKVMKDLVQNLLENKEVKPYFSLSANNPKRAKKLTRRLTSQFCQLTGGPCKYKAKSMLRAHKNMGISNIDFDHFRKAFKSAMKKNKVKEKEMNEVLKLVDGMKTEIVERNLPVKKREMAKEEEKEEPKEEDKDKDESKETKEPENKSNP